MKGHSTKKRSKSGRGQSGKTKRSKRKRPLGLAGFGSFGASHPAVSRVANEAANVFAVIGGLYAGNMACKGIQWGVDKFFPAKPEDAGKFRFVNLIAPIGTLAIGGGAVALGHHLGSEGGQHTIAGSFVKHVGYGVIGAGGVKLVKTTLKVDILAGLGAPANDEKFFKESADMLKKLVADNGGFKPALDEGTMGDAYNVPSTLRTDEMETIL